MADYLVDIVNEKDEVVGQCMRSEAHSKRLLHRIVHVLIFNDQDHILLQTRAHKGDGAEGKLDASVGGHVDAGEGYAEAAWREMKEELGIEVPLKFSHKHFQLTDADFIHVTSCYYGTCNGPFKTDPKETTKLKFYSKNEIREFIQKNPKLFPGPECLYSLKPFL